jgi:hypothetical protein
MLVFRFRVWVIPIAPTYSDVHRPSPSRCSYAWQVSLAGSSINTVLAVYTGNAVNALTRVASNDDCGTGVTHSCATFPVTPGVSYSIQVDAVGPAGAVSISLSVVTTVPPPPNDAFSQAGTVLPATGSTVGATLEPGEPPAVSGASGSIWYRVSVSPGATSALVRVGVGVWRWCSGGWAGVCACACAPVPVPVPVPVPMPMPVFCVVAACGCVGVWCWCGCCCV